MRVCIELLNRSAKSFESGTWAKLSIVGERVSHTRPATLWRSGIRIARIKTTVTDRAENSLKEYTKANRRRVAPILVRSLNVISEIASIMKLNIPNIKLPVLCGIWIILCRI